MRIHIVRDRETLWSLAKQYNVPVSRIRKANPQLTDNEPLAVGSKVRIPSGKVPVSQARSKEQNEQSKEEAQKGDSYQQTPNIAVDPDLFFLEQKQPSEQEHPNDEERPFYPPMPYHIPPYPSVYPHSFAPYSWINAPGPFYPFAMPFRPMPPCCGQQSPREYGESSSYLAD